MEGTLSSLIIVKLNLSESKAHPFYEFQPPKTLLQKVKKLHRTTTSMFIFSIRQKAIVHGYTCSIIPDRYGTCV